jgi:cytochrome c oxidase subunit 2
MTMSQTREGAETPDATPPAPGLPMWRRPPVFPILIIWAVLTALLLVFAYFVPARLLGVAAAPSMREVKSTMTAFSLAAAPVAAMVWAILLYSLFAWRHKGSQPPPETAPQIRGNSTVQTVWVLVSGVLCLFLLLWGLVLLQPPSSEANAATPPVVVNVTGNQWVWTFDYPDNPGVETDTPYLPINQRVLFKVTSKDVVHSFWIVEMAVKIDANPGEVTTVSVTPDRLGTFTIKCAELCGLLHSHMQTTVHVVTADEYAAWLKTAKAAAS